MINSKILVFVSQRQWSINWLQLLLNINGNWKISNLNHTALRNSKFFWGGNFFPKRCLDKTVAAVLSQYTPVTDRRRCILFTKAFVICRNCSNSDSAIRNCILIYRIEFQIANERDNVSTATLFNDLRFSAYFDIYDKAVFPDLSFYAKASTRGNNYKLDNHSFHYDLRKHFFLHVL